jgi:3-deoxy-D-manno-octulosonic-acid transferase
MKYDLPIAQEVLEHQGQRLLPKLHHRWVWCAGSTHPDEEIPILAAHLQLRKTIPEAILILAPRHLSHLEVIEGRLTQQGIVWMTWSSFLTATQVETSVQVILVDQLGVLISAYHISQACFVGGSLVPWGGHNMLEPAALKKPIVTGQHNHNFAEIADALSQHQALSNITEEQSLANLLIDWAQHPDIAQARGEAAYDVFLSQQGGTERLLSALSPWIASKWQGNPI